MTEVVSIKFKNRGKAYYFDPAGLDIQVGDSVIVSLGAVPHHHLALSVKELTYSSNSSSSLSFFPLTSR